MEVHVCAAGVVTWATSTTELLVVSALATLAALEALITAQPPNVAASEADVSSTLILLMAAARRLPVRVTFR